MHPCIHACMHAKRRVAGRSALLCRAELTLMDARAGYRKQMRFLQ